jgi:hypothetical protein
LNGNRLTPSQPLAAHDAQKSEAGLPLVTWESTTAAAGQGKRRTDAVPEMW